MANTTSVRLLNEIRDPADDDAWTRFDAVYRSFIVGFLNSRGVDVHLAEDVCQSVLKHVYEVMTEGRFAHNGRKGAFRKWLRQVVASQLGVYRRKAGRIEQCLPESLEERLAEAEEDSELVRMWNEEHNRATIGLVLELLREHTSAESLDIFRRTFIDGVSAEQAAEEFGRTRNAILVAKCKVLRKAREVAAGLFE
ncbi:MAG: sigma-70 family RNA polymerase sigma factor [Planctomycetaceae bacterium]|nr:sigma-70 family RNA polymerase sigma factor [Planctomycetaceae bacterium]